jgi:RNA polymerase sigma-70 factor (ECF subfamily)
MTHEEIAVVLGCSRRHVGDLLERLHTALREMEVVE